MRKSGEGFRALATLLLAGLLMAGCGQGTTNNYNTTYGGGGSGFSPTPNDWDGDGLSNWDEINIYGTSPMLVDTDGDGLTDYDEVVGFGFDPTGNNYLFNPLVADVPQIGVRITTTPSISLNATTSTGGETSYSVERTSSFSQSQTNSQSSTASTAVEITDSVSASLGFSGWSLSGSVSYDYSKSTSKEQSFTWSNDQTTENSQGLTNAQTQSANNSETLSGGSMSVAVDIVNAGNLGFTVENVIIGAVMLDPTSTAVLAPVGNLNLDTTFSSFPKFSLGPGQSSDNLVFTNNGLDLGTAETLLLNSTGLNVGVSAYEITDEQGRAFAHDLTAIGAKTATVMIDYAGINGRDQERYLVATKADPDRLRVTAGEVMRNILRIPFTTDAAGKFLTSVRNVAASDTDASAWLVLHRTSDGVDPVTTIYDPFNGPNDFENLELKAGDVLHLVYVIDVDHDGLRSRQEAAFGSDVNNPDTDGDGVLDGEEILWGLRPTEPETVAGVPDARSMADFFSTAQDSIFVIMRERDAVSGNPRVYMRGSNLDGDSGIGNATNPNTQTNSGLILSDMGQAWVVIAPGFGNTLAINGSGQLFHWGDNNGGIAGEGDLSSTDPLTPVQVGLDTDWVNVLERQAHFAFALKSNHTLWGWGRNESGQIGIGGGGSTGGTCGASEAPCVTALTQVPGTWQSVSLGGRHVLAIATDGSLWGWGANESGQLGIPIGSAGDTCTNDGGSTTYDCAKSPVQLAAPGVWTRVAAGGAFSVGIKANGTLWAWGANDSGQLGLGTTDATPVATPTQVGTALWADASAGGQHAVGIRTDGTLWSWGSGAGGRLGNGQLNNTNVYAPQQVGTANTWDRIWATEAATIARTTIPYKIVGWGRNDSSFLENASLESTCTGGISADHHCVPAPVQVFPAP
jgi:Regulator of chromosome condensation (RCC1) repeat/Bacterial TSP3 repeat